MIKAEDILLGYSEVAFKGFRKLVCQCETKEQSMALKQQILENQKRSDWLAIIEDLTGNKITDNESLGKLFQLIKKEKRND